MARETRNAKMQAYVDLMDLPVVLAAETPESFERILRYETELRDWFRIYPGWHLERNREMVRLLRMPALLTDNHALPGLKEPLDYLLLTLVLYLAEEMAARSGRSGAIGSRFLLSLLAGELVRLVQERYGSGVLDFGEIAHRRSLLRVMSLLEALGALARLDGSASEWADQTAAADGLYAFTEVSSRLLAGRVDEPSRAALLATSPTALRRRPLSVDDAEQRAWRSLLLGPALFAADDPPAFALVAQKHGFIGRELFDVFGWRLDIRKGMARVIRESHAQDAGGVLLSARLKSEYGPVLLLLNGIQTLVAAGTLTPDEHGGIVMAATRIYDLLTGLRQEHREILAGGLATCKAEELIGRCLSLMRENGMARGPDAYGDIYLTPLCALYSGIVAAPDAAAIAEREVASSEQLRLFD